MIRADEMLVLAPGRPRTVTVTRSIEVDAGALARWGMELVEVGGDVAVLDGPLADGAPVPAVLASGRSAGPSLRAVGYRTCWYRGQRVGGGDLVLHRPRMPWPVAPHHPGVLVAATGALVPAAVSNAMPGTVVHAVVVPSHPRRRVAYLVGRRRRGRSRWVVKAMSGPHSTDRGEQEQQTMRRLRAAGLGQHVPEPLGHGELDGIRWSVETVASGIPVARARRPWWQLTGVRVFEDVASWLGDLAVHSMRPPRSRNLLERGIEVVGDARLWVAPLEGLATSAPAVLTHGDLATGTNILVRGPRFMVIDWETASPEGLPLVDLLPTLCWGLARRRRALDPVDHAHYVVDLCAGEAAESAWLFAQVRRYLARLQIEPALAGPLAAYAWAHHGSMGRVHAERLRSAGDPVPDRPSAAELVLARWIQDRRLGRSWPALTGISR